MGVAEQFLEAAKVIDSGQVFFCASALYDVGMPVGKRSRYYDIYTPHSVHSDGDVADPRLWRVLSLLFAAEMVRSGDFK